ncbi:cellulase family glycosylhydrolase [Paenarthrobacter sp. Z7-10]|uniref:glycoside hydrolase 5 family protein n=1 Tax=Paenarthrobacter sp. Z7-10 TaxID=2787635 RepID=UPI0022A93ED6|nr:cellulase family glycosylhydrolase [Paenarthrobacter sp. Z7-10]MCZ2402847.1 cellulase family glycosylhydrolase [Paenarthrobacter sp. Z7-10]
MRRHFAKVAGNDDDDDGGAGSVVWLGANFWSRTGGPLMWRNYDGAVVRQELQVLAEHGLNMTRSFFYWPDFQPEPDRLDEQCCAHFADFLQAHHEIGMSTIPTFIVGHMSGENWDPSWRAGRNLYTDVWFVNRQTWYIKSLTARYAAHPAVAGWLITNEVPIYGGEASRAEVAAWSELMVNAVLAGGGRQPVSIGDGAWGIETTGHDNGFSLTDLAPFVDFVGPHVYRMETDVLRQHLKAAFICEMASMTGQPVVMEEFGLSSDFVSNANAGHYYRQLLYNTLLAGATGWIAWNNTDYDAIVEQRPYSHHPFELHFGITDAAGAPKPALRELKAFTDTLRAIDLPRLQRAEVSTALVLTSYLAADYPFTQEEERTLIVRTAEQSYVAAHEAHLPLAVVRETEDGGLPEGYGLYLLPSIKALTGPSWLQLPELARSGATIYASYCVGETGAQRGPWWISTEEIFGVERQLVYGLNNPIRDEVVELTFNTDFGTLKAGDVLRFTAAGNAHARAFLPVTLTDGTVIATDAHGNPALIVKEHGAGRTVLCTYPLEYLASAQGGVNPEDTHRLYQALAAVACIGPTLELADPLLFVDSLLHPDGREFVVLVSQHAEPADVSLPADAGLRTLDGANVEALRLDPFGVAVLQR